MRRASLPYPVALLEPGGMGRGAHRRRARTRADDISIAMAFLHDDPESINTVLAFLGQELKPAGLLRGWTRWPG